MSRLYQLNENVFLDNGVVTYDANSLNSGLKTRIGTYNTRLSKVGNVVYFKAYQFSDINNDDKVTIQKAIKSGSIDRKDLAVLINKSLILFNKLINFSYIDIIIAPESTALLNSLILGIISKKYPHLQIIKSGFVKRKGSEVTFHQDKLDTLDPSARKSVMVNLNKTLSFDDWKMKGIFQRNKKFLDKVLWPTSEHPVYGKNVVIIDDVITNGTTLKDMDRICKEQGANKVFGYVFMADK